MTRDELETRMSAAELTDWIAEEEIRVWEHKRAEAKASRGRRR